MGQAKSRGNQAQRIEQAQARDRAKFPASVKCNSCQADLTEIVPMNTRGQPGLWLAGGAICPACDSTTWVLEGEPDVVAATAATLQAQFAKDGMPD